MGFSTFLTVKCQQCEWKHEFYSSPEIEMKNSPGRNMQDVNLRAVLAFREIGRGHEAMKMFASCMNMPPPMAYKSYAAINDLLLDAYKESANESMVMAGKDVRTNIVGSDFQNTRVSVDGTWQKRGFSSMNGVVVAISDEGKVLDHQVMSKLCKSCSTWAKRKGTPEYEEWHTHHSCSMNHSKSSGAMEAEGAVEIFRRSETKHKLRYVEYIGDGDAGSFAKVVQSRPYGDSILPQKLECIGHVQKRVGTRLRNLRKEYKNKVLSDGKKLSGQGRLTDKCINTLQNFYGLAIRQNQGNLANMKRAIGAILYHCSNIPDKEIRHQFCPKTKDSWCKWQLDKLNNTSHHKDRINLSLAIKHLLEPIFRDLSSDSLLSKCLHGKTQNPNEAFNACIWQRCPKEVYVGRDALEIAVNSSVLHYNDGPVSLLNVFKKLNLPAGKFCISGLTRRTTSRIKNINSKSTESAKKSRKRLRGIRKGLLDTEKESEGGDSYQSGSH